MTYSRQELASLGKRASDLHRQQGMPLNDAIVKVANTTKGLSPEHVTRITENANLITFEEMFKESDSKHVVFDLADPVEVNNTLVNHDVESLRPSGVYLEPPTQAPLAVDPFIEHPYEKVSSAQRINHEFHDQQYMVKLNSAIQHVNSELNEIDSSAEYALYVLTDMVKKAALQCNALYPPMQVMAYVASDEDVFEKVSHVLAQSLSYIPRGEYREQAPNPDHPLVAQYYKVEELTKEASRYKKGMARLCQERDQLLSQRKLLGEFK